MTWMNSTQSIIRECEILKDDNNGTWHNLTYILNGSETSGPCLQHAPSLTDRAFTKAVILCVMATFSLLANLATIWSIVKSRKKRHGFSAVYILILHLSVADVFVTIFCIAGEGLWSYAVAWLWGNVACKVFKFLQMFSLYVSTFILVLIGIDRFIAVRYPMKNFNTTQRCSRFVLLAWISALFLSIPQLFIFRVIRGPFIEEFFQCVTYGSYSAPWQEQLYTTVSLIFMFILPLIILIVTYVSTVLTISRNEKVLNFGVNNGNISNQTATDINRRRLMQRAKSNSLRLSIVILAAFVIWWTPYYAMMIIFIFLNPDQQMSEDLLNSIFFFGMSNSLVNPLIYGAFHLWPRRNKSRRRFRFKSSVSLQHQSMCGHKKALLKMNEFGSSFVTKSQTKATKSHSQNSNFDTSVFDNLITESENNDGYKKQILITIKDETINSFVN